MIIRENEEVKTQIHDFYKEFKLRQTAFIFEDKEESITVSVKDKSGKEIYSKTYQPEHINCHINLVFQDKGIKDLEIALGLTDKE